VFKTDNQISNIVSHSLIAIHFPSTLDSPCNHRRRKIRFLDVYLFL